MHLQPHSLSRKVRLWTEHFPIRNLGSWLVTPIWKLACPWVRMASKAIWGKDGCQVVNRREKSLGLQQQVQRGKGHLKSFKTKLLFTGKCQAAVCTRGLTGSQACIAASQLPSLGRQQRGKSWPSRQGCRESKLDVLAQCSAQIRAQVPNHSISQAAAQGAYILLHVATCIPNMHLCTFPIHYSSWSYNKFKSEPETPQALHTTKSTEDSKCGICEINNWESSVTKSLKLQKWSCHKHRGK